MLSTWWPHRELHLVYFRRVMDAGNPFHLQDRGVEKIVLESTAQVICYSPKCDAKSVALHAWHPFRSCAALKKRTGMQQGCSGQGHLFCGRCAAPHQAHDEALPLLVCGGDEHYAFALACLVVPAAQSDHFFRICMEHLPDLGARLLQSYCGGGCWTKLPAWQYCWGPGQAQDAVAGHRGGHLAPPACLVEHAASRGGAGAAGGYQEQYSRRPEPAIIGSGKGAPGSGTRHCRHPPHLASMRKYPSLASVRGRDRMACSGATPHLRNLWLTTPRLQNSIRGADAVCTASYLIVDLLGGQVPEVVVLGVHVPWAASQDEAPVPAGKSQQCEAGWLAGSKHGCQTLKYQKAQASRPPPTLAAARCCPEVQESAVQHSNSPAAALQVSQDQT